MATSTLAPAGKQYFWNTITGAPLAGGFVATYLAGTSTPLPTYQDAAGLVPNTNPILLNSAGYATIYLTLGASYKFVVTSAAGVIQWTQDNILAVPAAAPAFDITGTAAVAIAVNQVAYLSDGSGGLNAGQWYLADTGQTYSSLTPLIGVAIASISAGAVGTFRLSGQLNTFAGLVAGAKYYVGAAGAITATLPALARQVGQADTTTDLVISADPPSLNPIVDVGICEGRLTLTAGTPVTVTDVTAAVSVFFTPYKGNRIALFDGTATWAVFTFVETTLSIGTISSGLPVDIFGSAVNGALALNLVGWTNGTTRATALTLQDGVLVQTGATNKRYLGTFYTTSATTTEDSLAKRYLWNYYNRVPRRLRRQESNNANSWAYTTATVRQANGNVLNQVALVVGWPEVTLQLRLNTTVANSTGGATAHVQSGIGADSLTVFDTTDTAGGQVDCTLANAQVAITAQNLVQPVIGFHFYAWLEWSAAVGTTTWNGNNVSLLTPNGLTGWIDG